MYQHDHACCERRQVTAFPEYGGMVFCFAIGAVVLGVPTTVHTPLSGHFSPVRAVVPIGDFMGITFIKVGFLTKKFSVQVL